MKIEIIKKQVLNNWHIMRWVRLVMGIFIGFQAVQMQSPLVGLMAAIFLFQALMNIGCCGPSGCEVKSKANNLPDTEEVTFEKVEMPSKSR